LQTREIAIEVDRATDQNPMRFKSAVPRITGKYRKDWIISNYTYEFDQPVEASNNGIMDVFKMNGAPLSKPK